MTKKVELNGILVEFKKEACVVYDQPSIDLIKSFVSSFKLIEVPFDDIYSLKKYLRSKNIYDFKIKDVSWKSIIDSAVIIRDVIHECSETQKIDYIDCYDSDCRRCKYATRNTILTTVKFAENFKVYNK